MKLQVAKVLLTSPSGQECQHNEFTFWLTLSEHSVSEATKMMTVSCIIHYMQLSDLFQRVSFCRSQKSATLMCDVQSF